MVPLSRLVEYCNVLLEAESCQDYCPNGLQVEGRGEVRRLASGVTANQALIDASLAWGADAILVHHGFFWKGEPAVITGLRRRRLRALLCADVSLLAYHLPLDAHPVHGNNAQLAARLGLKIERSGPAGPWCGRLPGPMPAPEFAALLERALGQRPLHIDAGHAPILRLAWCSGAAQDYLDQAVAAGVDAYLTGEISERHVHIARESGVHFFAAGHHATERFGVQALGEHLAQRFGIEHRYLDVASPV